MDAAGDSGRRPGKGGTGETGMAIFGDDDAVAQIASGKQRPRTATVLAEVFFFMGLGSPFAGRMAQRRGLQRLLQR